MQKVITLLTLAVSLASRGQDNLNCNPVALQSIPPGAVIVYAHDPLYGTDTNYTAVADNCMEKMNDFLSACSYGRNWFVFDIDSTLQTNLCGGTRIAPGVIIMNIQQGNPACLNGGLGWNYPYMMHEMSHYVGGWGEGSAWNGTSYVAYGDFYDIMGHGSRQWNSAYKEFGGLLGPQAARPLTCVEASGDYYITDAESLSPGPKALKVLHAQKDVIFQGRISSSRKEFFYLEMRNNLSLGTVTTGKGKRRTTTTSTGPGVLARTGGVTYWPGSNTLISIEELLWLNIGSNGAMKAGQGYGYTSVFTSVDATPIPPAPAITNTVSRSVSFSVLSVDSLGATVHVQIN